MKKREFRITGLLVLTIFAVYALCILGVLLAEADSYQSLVDRGEEIYTCRTVAQYLATRVRQADIADGLHVETFGGLSALVFRQEVDEETYLTRIYCYDGSLRELFTAEEGAFSPEDGEILLPLQQLSFEKQGASLSASFVTDRGQSRCLNWYLRSEVAP